MKYNVYTDSVDNPLKKPGCRERRNGGGWVGGCTQTALVIASIEKPEARVGRPEYDGAGLGLGVMSRS